MTWSCRGCAGENPEGTRFCGHCGARQDDPSTPAVTEEHRLVTALFADVSGSPPSPTVSTPSSSTT